MTRPLKLRDAAWKADRGDYFGGSDWGDAMNIDPWGCRRRLCYEKRGVQPDYPEEVTPAMDRGRELEEAVVQKYLAETGNKIARGRRHLPRAMPDWWKGEPDRLVQDVVTHQRIVLECKTAGERSFSYVKRNGLSLAYVAQGMHYLGLTGLQRCDLAMLWPDGWELLIFPIFRDEALLAQMREVGDRFMRQVEHGPAPERLDGKDKRCRKCQYRHSCQGVALLEAAAEEGDEKKVQRRDEPELLAMVRAEREAAEVAAEATAMLEVCREKLKKELWSCPAVEIGGYRVYFRATAGKRLDVSAFRKAHPEIAAQYEKSYVTRTLRIYEI